MKLPLNITISLFVICTVTSHASGLAQGKRFETTGYFSMFSYGKNISLQTEISGGINFFDYMNISVTANAGYRNYSLETNDYLSASIGRSLGDHEVRLGLIGGIYTLWFSGYQATIPCLGGEALYSFTINPGLSVRIKERICNFSDNHHNLISTSTLVGLCFAFGSR